MTNCTNLFKIVLLKFFSEFVDIKPFFKALSRIFFIFYYIKVRFPIIMLYSAMFDNMFSFFFYKPIPVVQLKMHVDLFEVNTTQKLLMWNAFNK